MQHPEIGAAYARMARKSEGQMTIERERLHAAVMDARRRVSPSVGTLTDVYAGRVRVHVGALPVTGWLSVDDAIAYLDAMKSWDADKPDNRSRE